METAAGQVGPRLVEYVDATPEVRAVFDDIKATRGVADVNNLWKALAVHPPTLARTWTGVKEVMAPGALDPLPKELLYLVASMVAGCTYCTAFHGMLLRGVAKDEQFADTLAADFTQAGLSPRHRAMLDFAVKVNRDAEAITEEDRAGLRAVGFDDEAIFMICSTAAFYAGANRLAQAIGLRPSNRYGSMHRAAPARATG